MTSAGIVNPLSIDPNERVTPSHHHMMSSTDHTGEKGSQLLAEFELHIKGHPE